MIIIVICFFLINSCLYLFFEQNFRESAIRSYLLILGFVAISTEVLSLFNQITYISLLICWSIFVVILLSILGANYKSLKYRIQYLVKRACSNKQQHRSFFEILIWVTIGLILLITLVIAVLSPPNNYDSMTYHMARVANWIQHQNINYYTTSIPRQNYSMPLAEYAILHLQLMSQTDVFANIVQWFSFLISMLLVWEIADYLKVSQRGKMISVLFVATLPMAILQSSSTQNDLITGILCLSFAYYLMKATRDKSWNVVFFSGLSLGLALLTKGTAYIYCAVFGLGIGIAGLLEKNRSGRFALINKMGVIILFALVMNGGVYSRNMMLYSHPLSTENEKITSENLSITGLGLNLIRNSSTQLALPLPFFNKLMTQKVLDILGKYNNDPRYIFPESKFEIKYSINEDEAGNFLHFGLLCITVICFPWIKDLEKKDHTLLLGIFLVSIIVYSLTLKWQPWGSRLQLPIFLLGAPLAGYAIDKARFQIRVNVLLLITLVGWSIPVLALNQTRPLVPLFHRNSPFRSDSIKNFFSDRPALYDEYREIIAPFYKDKSILRTDRNTQYFSGSSYLMDDYKQVMVGVSDLDTDVIGLQLASNIWEYPIWVFAGNNAKNNPPEFIHVGVTNITKDLGPPIEYLPDYIITSPRRTSMFIEDLGYTVIVDTPTLDLLRK